MVWPSSQLKTHIDQSTDDPKQARGEFAGNVDKFNQLQAHVSSFMQGLLDDADAGTARATLDALQNIFTTRGDIIRRGASDEERLALGASGTVLTSDGTDAIWQAGGLPRGYSNGCQCSRGTDTVNDIDITIGAWRSTDNAADLIVASAIGKQIDVSWASGGTPGAPTGGLSSNLTLTNDVWYHVILGLVSGTVEIGFDTSITGANLISDHTFTNIRRIFSIRRVTALNKLFTQDGDSVFWDDPPLDVNVTNLGNTRTLYELLIPPGVKSMVIFASNAWKSGVASNVYISSPDSDDEVPSQTAAPLSHHFRGSNADTANIRGGMMTRSNDSSQIGVRATLATVTFQLVTYGWIDSRGKND